MSTATNHYPISFKSFENSVVVITGGSSGIGLETARLFAKAGAKVAILARSAEKLAKARQEIQSSGGIIKDYPTDVTDEAAVKEVFDRISVELGPVEILVNNAGIGFATNLATCSITDFRKIIETNITGIFLCTRAVLGGMQERKKGHIINISSVAGKVANPVAPLYCSSKHAVNGFTSGLQQQVAAQRIRVTTVSPSAVDTAYWDGRNADRSKFLKPEEIASTIFFVASQPDGVLIKDVEMIALR